jgi:hypothetical protein
MTFDIDKARWICNKATPGPWIYGIYPDNCDLCEECEYDPRSYIDIECNNPIKLSWKPIAMIGDGYCVPGIYASDSKLDDGNANGKFIAEARTLLPAALDRIDELENALIKERANIKISKFCNCEKCWPLGEPKSDVHGYVLDILYIYCHMRGGGICNRG